MRCRYPVLGSAPRICCEHQGSSMDVPKLPIMNRLVTPEGIYMYKKETMEVFSLNGTLCGRIKGNKLLLFDIQV